ncbi:unnamed protein product [marine sediment metagenome]|uniref:Uncharacterized protein n=1 Tax=marine sediment metagenome TaxID=412755 RepID=X1LPU4_9ZZZZ
MKRPTKPCCACGSTDFWQRIDGEWLCNTCHPNPNPGSNPGSNPDPGSLPVVEEEHSPEVIALRDRVIRGNEKLNKAWLQIKAMDGEEREEQMERIEDSSTHPKHSVSMLP